jgi:hypothetical protein
MSHRIRSETTFDKPERFREWVFANAMRDGEVELLDEDGNVVDRATIVDGSIHFERSEKTNKEEA